MERVYNAMHTGFDSCTGITHYLIDSSLYFGHKGVFCIESRPKLQGKSGFFWWNYKKCDLDASNIYIVWISIDLACICFFMLIYRYIFNIISVWYFSFLNLHARQIYLCIIWDIKSNLSAWYLEILIIKLNSNFLY